MQTCAETSLFAWSPKPVSKQPVYKLGQIHPLPFIFKAAPGIPLDGLSHEDRDVGPLRVATLALVVAGKGPFPDRRRNGRFGVSWCLWRFLKAPECPCKFALRHGKALPLQLPYMPPILVLPWGHRVFLRPARLRQLLSR